MTREPATNIATDIDSIDIGDRVCFDDPDAGQHADDPCEHISEGYIVGFVTDIDRENDELTINRWLGCYSDDLLNEVPEWIDAIWEREDCTKELGVEFHNGENWHHREYWDDDCPIGHVDTTRIIEAE